ncbi:MAG: cytochrome c biogenesis CcdA family protein, partial [Terriglobales bacterium]
MSSLPLPIAAFLAGLVSFLSPCVLPLVPGYISLISGVGVEELQAEEKGRRRVVLLSSLMFVLGFSVVFISLGAVATTLGRTVREYFPWLIRIAGIVIIVFGLHLTGLLKIKWLYADKRLHNLNPRRSALGAFLVGFA